MNMTPIRPERPTDILFALLLRPGVKTTSDGAVSVADPVAVPEAISPAAGDQVAMAVTAAAVELPVGLGTRRDEANELAIEELPKAAALDEAGTGIVEGAADAEAIEPCFSESPGAVSESSNDPVLTAWETGSAGAVGISERAPAVSRDATPSDLATVEVAAAEFAMASAPVCSVAATAGVAAITVATTSAPESSLEEASFLPPVAAADELSATGQIVVVDVT
jgi:predicted membrane-bound mannosyltransferase